MGNKDAVRTNVLLVVLFMIIVISAAVFINLKSGLAGGNVVEIKGSTMVDGVDAWNNFIKKSNQNRNCFVRIKYKNANGTSKSTLRYKDGEYSYTDASGKVYKNKKLLDLRGYMSNDDVYQTRVIVLADNNYDFDEIMLGNLRYNGEKPYTVIISLTVGSVENGTVTNNVTSQN